MSSITLIVLGLLIQRHVGANGRIPIARAILIANSYLYAAASLWFCSVIISSLMVAPHKEVGPPGWLDSDEALRNVYHFSKLYEYLDIWLVLANGGDVGLHFAIHHLTVRYLLSHIKNSHPFSCFGGNERCIIHLTAKDALPNLYPCP